MSREDRYFAQSWALLTRDKGWTKPLLVMAAAQTASVMLLLSAIVFIVAAAGSSGGAIVAGLIAFSLPVLIALLVVVSLAISGYMLEWARLTAWEVDAAPKQRGVQIGACIKAGWRGFVAALGYGVVFSLLASLLSGLFSNTFLSALVALVVMVANIFVSVALIVVRLRATIYQRISAGYRFARIWDMVSSDAVGLAKIAGIMVLIGLVAGAVVSIVGTVTGISVLVPALVGASGSGSTANVVLGAIASIMSWCVPTLFVAMLFETFGQLIGNTAVALWMRQFHVPLWGGSNDPLPSPGGLPPSSPSYGSPYTGATTDSYHAPSDVAATVGQNDGARDADAAPAPTPSPSGFDAVDPAPMGTSVESADEGHDAFVNANSSWPVAGAAPTAPTRDADAVPTSADAAISTPMSATSLVYEGDAAPAGFAPPNPGASPLTLANADAVNAATVADMGVADAEAFDSNPDMAEQVASDDDVREPFVSSQPWSHELPDLPMFPYADGTQKPWQSGGSAEAGMVSSVDEANPVSTMPFVVEAPVELPNSDDAPDEQVDASAESPIS